MRKIKSLNAIGLGKNLTIAIDVDGTVADGSKVDLEKVDKDPNEFLKVEPKKGALVAVQKLYINKGIRLFFIQLAITAAKA